MIARGAQWNPSAFRKEGLLPFGEVVRAYIKKVSSPLFFFFLYQQDDNTLYSASILRMFFRIQNMSYCA